MTSGEVKVTTNTVTSVLHQLSLHLLKDIICTCAIESCNGLESCHSEISM